MSTPEAERPYPLEGYGIPESSEGLLPWSYVVQRLTAAKTYWVCTVHPDGTPHARPVWGVFVEGLLYVGGGPNTRWAQNLRANGQMGIHLEDGTSAVIIEGQAAYITEDKALIAKTDAAYLEKYNIPHGPVWQIRPKKVIAWHEKLDTMTRWRF